MSEQPEKRVEFYMHGRDREIIDRMKKRYGCTTATAIRACIRIAADVKLELSPINSD